MVQQHHQLGKPVQIAQVSCRLQPPVWLWNMKQVPEGSGEQEKMEKTGCKIICGAPTTLAVKGLMMMMMKHEPCLLTLKKGFRLLKPGALGNFSASSTWSTRPTTGCGARPTSLWVHGNLFWQLSRDGNLRGSGMSHATTASPKLSFRAPRRVDDAVVGRGNGGWTTSKCGHPCPCQNCPQEPPAEKTGRGSLLNCPSCPPLPPPPFRPPLFRPPPCPPPPCPPDPVGQGTGLNWII